MADGFISQINPVTEGIVEFGCARYNEAGIDWLFRVVKEMIPEQSFYPLRRFRSTGTLSCSIWKQYGLPGT